MQNSPSRHSWHFGSPSSFGVSGSFWQTGDCTSLGHDWFLLTLHRISLGSKKIKWQHWRRARAEAISGSLVWVHQRDRREYSVHYLGDGRLAKAEGRKWSWWELGRMVGR